MGVVISSIYGRVLSILIVFPAKMELASGTSKLASLPASSVSFPSPFMSAETTEIVPSISVVPTT